MWLSIKDVKNFDVPIGAVVKSVDGLGMLLTDDHGEVRVNRPFPRVFFQASFFAHITAMVFHVLINISPAIQIHMIFHIFTTLPEILMTDRVFS